MTIDIKALREVAEAANSAVRPLCSTCGGVGFIVYHAGGEEREETCDSCDGRVDYLEPRRRFLEKLTPPTVLALLDSYERLNEEIIGWREYAEGFEDRDDTRKGQVWRLEHERDQLKAENERLAAEVERLAKLLENNENDTKENE